MNDQFLNHLRREPRPEFARGLRERLRGQEQAASRPWRTINLPVALAAAFLAVAIGALFAFPVVRASAQAFLDLFRVRGFTAVQFDPARLDKLRSLEQDNALLVFDQQEVILDPGAPQAFPTPEAAGAAAGLEVRGPAFLPDGMALDTVLVEGAGEARLTLHESRLRALLDALDLNDVQIPPGLDGQAVTVRKPPIVIQRFRKDRWEAMLVQARSPEVSLPAGVELERLGEIGLRVLGLDPDEARKIAASIDWHTTLVVPVPMNASSFRNVTVRGNPGLLVTVARDKAGEGRRYRDGTIVMWTEGERVFGLTGNLSGPDLMQVAESVQ